MIGASEQRDSTLESKYIAALFPLPHINSLEYAKEYLERCDPFLCTYEVRALNPGTPWKLSFLVLCDSFD